jgi:hypothetical protein
MPRRRNSDLQKIQASTDTVRPYCGACIEPKDYRRVDWKHLECPRCGKTFIPTKEQKIAGLDVGN